MLVAYTLAGNKIGEFKGHESYIWAVAASPDGRYLISGAADQTVRLWNLKTRELLVTLYRGSDGEWVMWTPQGYYASSPAGAELIGWQINQGPENAADYVTAAQLRTKLNRPDIVAKAIQLASAEEAVRQAPGASFKLSDLLAMPVPRFRIVAPAPGAALTGGSTQLELALEDTAVPVKLIRIQVNGTQVIERQSSSQLKFTIPLYNGNNIIRAVAINGVGETAEQVNVTHDGEGALDKRGTLYILAIGVDKYPNLPKHDLPLFRRRCQSLRGGYGGPLRPAAPAQGYPHPREWRRSRRRSHRRQHPQRPGFAAKHKRQRYRDGVPLRTWRHGKRQLPLPAHRCRAPGRRRLSAIKCGAVERAPGSARKRQGTPHPVPRLLPFR